MRILASLMLLAFAAAAPLGAAAGSMQVRPVHIEMTRGARSATATIINQTGEPLRIQVTGYTWEQTSQGEMKLTPSDDVILFPSLLVIPPLGSKSVRVALEAPPGDVEKTYRLYFEELPSLQSQLHPGNGPMLVLREKIGIPIFFSAQGNGTGKVVVRDARVSGGRVAFSLHNDGSAHAMVTNLTLAANDAAGRPLYSQKLKTWYILAGGTRVYDAKIPAGACGKIAQVTIAGKGDGTPAFVEHVPASSGCAR